MGQARETTISTAVRSACRNRRFALTLPVLVVLAALAAGCGGGGDKNSTANSANSTQVREEALQKHRDELQHFGLEATGSEAKQAEAALHGYLDARANEEWSKACSYQSQAIRNLFARFGKSGQANGQTKGKGCAGFMETATRKLSASERADLGKVHIYSVRVEEDQGYILYRDASGAEYAMSMKLEGKKWKLVGDRGTPLS